MTPTLLLSPRFHSDSQDLWRAAVRRGWGIHRCINYAPPADPAECCIYGEILLCDIMADRCDLGLLDPPDDWLAKLPTDLVKRDLFACRVADLENIRWKAFVKPANDKVFQYGVYQCGADVPVRYVDPECPCLVSEVVDWDLEVRLYVLDQKIVTLEYYRLIGEHAEEDVRAQAKVFGGAVLAAHGDELPSAVVLDVGHIEGRGWAVIEPNQAYASGIYGEADTDAILDVVRRSAGPLAMVSERDRKFLRPRIGQ